MQPITMRSQPAVASGERYGSDAVDVELDRQTAIARIDGGRRRDSEPTDAESAAASTWPAMLPGSGVPAPDRTVIGGELPNPPQSCGAKRVRRRPRSRGASSGPKPTSTPIEGDADTPDPLDSASNEAAREEE